MGDPRKSARISKRQESTSESAEEDSDDNDDDETRGDENLKLDYNDSAHLAQTIVQAWLHPVAGEADGRNSEQIDNSIVLYGRREKKKTKSTKFPFEYSGVQVISTGEYNDNGESLAKALEKVVIDEESTNKMTADHYVVICAGGTKTCKKDEDEHTGNHNEGNTNMPGSEGNGRPKAIKVLKPKVLKPKVLKSSLTVMYLQATTITGNTEDPVIFSNGHAMELKMRKPA